MGTPVCTPEMVQEARDLVAKYGSVSAAAANSPLSRGAIDNRLRQGRKMDLREEVDDLVPAGFAAKGVSTLYDANGDVRAKWVKTDVDREKAFEALRNAADALCSDITPAPPIAAPAASLAALCTLYTFTDYHVGALCWHKEGGDDWDVSIAYKLGTQAMRALVDGSPPAQHAIVNIQGDFLHFDGLESATPTSGHILDADSRFGRVVEVAIRLIRRLVDIALTRHETVTLLVCEGNHDIASSVWLRKLFAALYENEPRLNVHDSELPYYAIKWGRTMLGFHHGHLKKNIQLPELFAAQFREMWGQCDKVAIHTGHYHHREMREHAGCEVIRHPTLAARDAYAARHGWLSQRRITAITYHAEHGEVGTTTVTPEMLEAA